jgi:hypothetical protein
MMKRIPSAAAKTWSRVFTLLFCNVWPRDGVFIYFSRVRVDEVTGFERMQNWKSNAVVTFLVELKVCRNDTEKVRQLHKSCQGGIAA